jgi:hypothetical protein
LRAGIPDIRPAGGPAWIVFWWGSLPLGARPFSVSELPPAADLMHALAARLIADQVTSRAEECVGAERSDPLRALDLLADAAPQRADDLGVVIVSHGRTEALRACLAALDEQLQRPGEIIVLDCSRERAAGPLCRERPELLHVLSPRPTADVACAAGLRVCSRPVVAFIEEDVTAAPNWASEIVRAFAAPGAVEALAGLVLPTPVGDHDADTLAAALGALDNPFARTRFEGDSRARAARHGARSAGNVAFRRGALARIAASEPSPGGLAEASGAAELWSRLRASGAACVYEPRAVVQCPVLVAVSRAAPRPRAESGRASQSDASPARLTQRVLAAKFSAPSGASFRGSQKS